MRGRLLLALLAVSVAANVGLYVAWQRVPRPAFERFQPAPRPAPVHHILRPIRTNLVIEPRLLTWRDIESEDYVTYIRNLRSIGCPEATVRDIIVADVTGLFASRRATEVLTPAQQWWKSDPDLDVVEHSIEQRDALERERRSLLTQLLGPGWDAASTSTEVAGSSITLDGPLLGDLPAETKHTLREIELRNRERLRAHLQARREQGGTADPAEVARLRRETREELARILTPAQLEEYLLRYSGTADELRRRLRGFEATPDEFRSLFRATDAIEMELEALPAAGDVASQNRRRELEARRDSAIQEVLGTSRHEYYRLNQDPAFRQVRETAERLGVPPEAVLPVYQIDQVTDEERRRILADTSLSPEQQSAQLATVGQKRLDSLRQVLGDDRFRLWQEAGPRGAP
ncbi:MAG TPA: hypothetical protein PKM73_11615 [Verrucomicrobiota bacterium]|nr:hypothetical protein [Verrucomicrobiota bacterium]HNU51398.1 hypothetical protein [Verrucomicrobiota bacterium]